MGAVFLATQINEYFKAGFAISDGAFASIFYGLTGLHGAHVFVGLTLLAITNIRTLRGHFTRRRTWESRRPASTGTSWT